MYIPEELIRIAQNDYMIDGDYLPDGKLLIFAARKQEYLEEKVESLERELSAMWEDAASEAFWASVRED